jgi:CDP-glucose 4,6-dehydratase
MLSDYQNKRVFVTGHTGFKGSWLCQWLLSLGADVKGYALDPPTQPSLFESLGLSEQMIDVRADIRDRQRLSSELIDFQPHFVFHLAAQPLVRYSYSHPLVTYETNVTGTIYLLDALRQLAAPCAAVMVTSDKCYENREWVYGYREEDPMGGSDPYSSSKGMAELAISAYRKSYFKDSPVRISSARAGNVIGGGDWALDRIIPDCIRACQQQIPIEVRNPEATRPWQHVLDPLSGYLLLGSKLLEAETSASYRTQLEHGFNFGPSNDSNRTVRDVVTALLEHLPGKWIDKSTINAPHEARFLHLSTDKANKILNWQSKWNFAETIRHTADWYHCYLSGGNVRSLTQQQIELFAG